MKTRQIQTQKGEKITPNIHQEFLYNPGNSIEYALEPLVGSLSSIDSKTREWFLENLYINDTTAWAKDYKRRIHTSEESY